MSRRAPALEVRPVALASCPSAQSKAYAICQPTSAIHPNGPGTPVEPAADDATTSTTEVPTPSATLTRVRPVGEIRRRLATSASTAPRRWLSASLYRPPPRLVANRSRYRGRVIGGVVDSIDVVCQSRTDLHR